MTSDAIRPEFDPKTFKGVLATSKLRPTSILEFMGYLGVFVGYITIFTVSLLTVGFLEIRQSNMRDFNALIAVLDERDRYTEKYLAKGDLLAQALKNVEDDRQRIQEWIGSQSFCSEIPGATIVPGNGGATDPGEAEASGAKPKTCADIRASLQQHANQLASTEDEIQFRLANLPFYYDQYEDGITQKTPQIIPALGLVDSHIPLLTVWARASFELIEMFLLVCMGLLGGVISVMRCFVDPSLKKPAIAEFFYKPAAGAAISLGVYVVFRAAQIFLGVQSEAGAATVSTSIFLLAGLGLASGFCATAALAQIEFVALRLLRSSGPGANNDRSAENPGGSAPDHGYGPNSGPAAAAPTPG